MVGSRLGAPLQALFCLCGWRTVSGPLPYSFLGHPVSGRDPQKGDDDDRDDEGCSGSGPPWAHVAPAQTRGGFAPVAGEDLDTVSRSLGVTAATLSTWRDAFLTAGEASLATRPATGEALETERLKARLGEMLLERELLEAKIAGLESDRP
jgi:transposase